jgi:hypothetical protein
MCGTSGRTWVPAADAATAGVGFMCDGDVPVVSSLAVADFVEKRHDNVLKVIEKHDWHYRRCELDIVRPAVAGGGRRDRSRR